MILLCNNFFSSLPLDFSLLTFPPFIHIQSSSFFTSLRKITLNFLIFIHLKSSDFYRIILNCADETVLTMMIQRKRCEGRKLQIFMQSLRVLFFFSSPFSPAENIIKA